MTQLETAKTSTDTTCFTLAIYGCGGEHTIGTASTEVASYWEEEDEIFQEYMFSWDRDEVIEKYNISEKYHLKEWNELDDLAHINGPEFVKDSTYIDVIDDETKDKILEFLITEENLEIEEEPEVPQELENKLTVVYGQQWNKGTFSFGPIESEEPFDPSKLKIKCSCWEDLQIITHIEYEGEFYGVEEESSGKSQIIFFS